jgi:uncharacterized protein (TIGR02284 family)
MHGKEPAMDNDDVIDTLNTLIETSKDGEYGFRACSEHATSAELKASLAQHAEECLKGARELQTCVVKLGGKPDEKGTASGSAHRGWVALRGSLTGYTDEAMLEECERGEDVAVARYRDALEEPLPEDVKQIVERQYQGVRRNHDQVRDMRNRIRAAH